MRLQWGQLGEAFFDPFVFVAQALLKALYLLADDRKTEVPWFNDARMYRPDRDLVHAIALDANECVVGDFSMWTSGSR